MIPPLPMKKVDFFFWGGVPYIYIYVQKIWFVNIEHEHVNIICNIIVILHFVITWTFKVNFWCLFVSLLMSAVSLCFVQVKGCQWRKVARRTSRARHRDIHRLGTCSLPTSFYPNNISPLFLKFCLDVGCVDSSISDSASLGMVCRLWLGSNGKLHIDTSLQANSEKQEGPRFQMVRDGHM